MFFGMIVSFPRGTVVRYFFLCSLEMVCTSKSIKMKAKKKERKKVAVKSPKIRSLINKPDLKL